MAQLKVRTLTCDGVRVVADLIKQHVSIHRALDQDFSDDGRPGFRRSGVVEIHWLEHGEPLLAEHGHSVDVIAGQPEPLGSLRPGAAVVRLCDQVLEAKCDASSTR